MARSGEGPGYAPPACRGRCIPGNRNGDGFVTGSSGKIVEAVAISRVCWASISLPANSGRNSCGIYVSVDPNGIIQLTALRIRIGLLRAVAARLRVELTPICTVGTHRSVVCARPSALRDKTPAQCPALRSEIPRRGSAGIYVRIASALSVRRFSRHRRQASAYRQKTNAILHWTSSFSVIRVRHFILLRRYYDAAWALSWP